jgi:hypothetical protein
VTEAYKDWKGDLQVQTTTHTAGFMVRFQRTENEQGGWKGNPLNGKEWIQKFGGENPRWEIVNYALRLSEETKEAYAWQLKNRPTLSPRATAKANDD